MLLTGFDAPIEQVMYIDKRVKDHNLLQTIARVNRIAKGKTRGYIVDYIGLTDHLKNALSIYAADDQKDVEGDADRHRQRTARAGSSLSATAQSVRR
jgi:type I restriction enzyme R subunit